MNKLLQLQLQKIAFSLSHPGCWRALMAGVAPSVEHWEVLKGLDCDLLLDVGANRGQFSLMARSLHPHLPIHAYEPLPTEAAYYRRLMGRRSGITLHELALGNETSEVELHVSGRADSSSLLPIGELQTRFFPTTKEVRIQRVQVAPLDSLEQHWAQARQALLKLDVQGFELNVLRGAERALKHCAYIYAECSHLPLYTGQALYPEIEVFLRGHGFAPMQRANEQWAESVLIQADYLFGRRPVAKK